MTGTMQAAVVEAFGQPLALRELKIPTPGPGQILVRTEACGVCHTDLHAAQGDWPLKPTLPFIPGHEAIGLVAALGAGVKGVREGDRVGVPWLHSACGHCEYCLTGREPVCAEARFGGFTVDGGFAEYLLADPAYVAHIPEGLEAAAAAPIICAGLTTYKGIKESGARPGQWLAISGAGGLGHLAVQYAKAMGLLVCAIDNNDGKLAHAKRLGAAEVVVSKNPDEMNRHAGSFDFILDTASASHDLNPYLALLKLNGTMTLVGAPDKPAPIAAFNLIMGRRSLAGSGNCGLDFGIAVGSA